MFIYASYSKSGFIDEMIDEFVVTARRTNQPQQTQFFFFVEARQRHPTVLLLWIDDFENIFDALFSTLLQRLCLFLVVMIISQNLLVWLLQRCLPFLTLLQTLLKHSYLHLNFSLLFKATVQNLSILHALSFQFFE